MADEALPRRSDHQRRDGRQLARARQDFQIVIERLAEADPRIDEDLRRGDSGGNGRVAKGAQLTPNLAHHVIILNVLLHRGRVAAHVHEDDRHFCHRGHGGHSGRVAKRAHVVDDVRAGSNCFLRHRSLSRVDGDWDAAALPDLFDHRHDAIDFQLRGDRLRSGTRRFSADVDHRRAILLHPQRGLHRIGMIEIDAAVGEGVGSDVDDAHDAGRVGDVELATSWKIEFERGTMSDER